ncbi:membrane protein [Myxococcus hansupus]|uniref:Membrane protein n=2 Tax=Pseudomyxococcus hansupus TaxID=1297742 RepID=A0A0H4WYS1_9BACT|nr:membrane protein [Myxococcus hansupus]
MSRPNPTPSDLRPLAMGEMIDRAATFWRAHLKPLFLLSFGFSLVSYIATKTALVVGQRVAPLLYMADAESLAKEAPEVMLPQAAVTITLWTGLFLVLLWVYWMSTLAAARYVLTSQLGDPVRPADALRRAFSRLGTLTAVYLLSLGWSTLVTCVLMLPGGLLAIAGIAVGVTSGSNTVAIVLGVLGALLAGLGMVAALLWYMLRFLLVPPVLAMEDLGAWATFRRSGQLLSGRVEPGFLGRVMVRAMILFTVVSLILISVQLVSGLPSWLAMLPYGNPFEPGTMARTPQLLLVPMELLQTVAQSVFSPINFVFCALFYLDMRVRREALDLEHQLDTTPPAA